MPTATTATIDLIKANYERRKDITGELRELDTKLIAEKRAASEDETSHADGLRRELTDIDNRISANIEMEQRSQQLAGGLEGLLGAVLNPATGSVEDARSIGERFAASEEVRAWVAGGARGNSPALHIPESFRAITTTTLGATSGGPFAAPERLDRIGQDNLDRRTYLLDLLYHIPVKAATQYVQDTSPLADMADAAAEKAEGTAANKAGITTALKTENPATIKAYTEITRETAEDAEQLVAYLDGRLRYALKRRGDKQAIGGDGIGANLLGLANRSGILTYAPAAAESRSKTIRGAIRRLEDAEAVGEIIVLNPADAELFDLSNADTAGLHAVQNIAGPSATTAWGLTQVRSTAIAPGTALILDPIHLAVLDRKDATAYMTDSHGTGFIDGILTLLLEARVGLALFDPKGVIKVTFNGAA